MKMDTSTHIVSDTIYNGCCHIVSTKLQNTDERGKKGHAMKHNTQKQKGQMIHSQSNSFKNEQQEDRKKRSP